MVAIAALDPLAVVAVATGVVVAKSGHIAPVDLPVSDLRVVETTTVPGVTKKAEAGPVALATLVADSGSTVSVVLAATGRNDCREYGRPLRPPSPLVK